MKVCLVQYNPVYPKPCQLDAYNEVVESYLWGFTALGHEVKRLINHCDPNALNIVFGFMIPYQLKLLDSFPPNTIIFNMEQGVRKAWINSNVHYALGKYQWWDYSLGNVAALNALNPKFPVYYAKTAYAPILEKLPPHAAPDIDVLYYGHLTADRTAILENISSQRGDLSGLSVTTLSNVWDKQRDEFIARSKIVVNLSRDNSYIFEIVRVSYLLANKKAVVYCHQWQPVGN